MCHTHTETKATLQLEPHKANYYNTGNSMYVAMCGSNGHIYTVPTKNRIMKTTLVVSPDG